MSECFEYIKLDPNTDVVVIHIDEGWVSWILWENDVDWKCDEMVRYAKTEMPYPTRMQAILNAFERGIAQENDYDVDEYYDEETDYWGLW